MIASLSPAGFPPSEVKHWSLSEYRAVQDAFNDAHEKDEEPKVPYPDIEDFRKFKRQWAQKSETVNVPK